MHMSVERLSEILSWQAAGDPGDIPSRRKGYLQMILAWLLS